MGSKAGALRAAVREPEEVRLCPAPLWQPLRREHLLGQWVPVEAGGGSRGLGVGAEVLQLPVELVRRREGMWALHADCVEGKPASWVRQGALRQRQGRVYDLQL